MNNINEIVARFETVRAMKAAAEKEEKQLRAELLRYAAGRSVFETEGFTVMIKTTSRVTLDTAALYKDFPDMRDVYGRTSTTTTVTTAAKQAELASA